MSNLGHLSGSVVEHLPSAQVVILGSWDRVLHWAPCREPASPSACVSHEYLSKGAATVENSLEGPREVKNKGSLGGAAVWCLPLAQGVILETQDRIPRQAPGAWTCFSLCLCLCLSLSLCDYHK